MSCVVGLESVGGPETVRALLGLPGGEGVIFSLDLKNGQPLGELSCWCGADAWSIVQEVIGMGLRRVIVLDLARVGEGGRRDKLCQRISRTSAVELMPAAALRGWTLRAWRSWRRHGWLHRPCTGQLDPG